MWPHTTYSSTGYGQPAPRPTYPLPGPGQAPPPPQQQQQHAPSYDPLVGSVAPTTRSWRDVVAPAAPRQPVAFTLNPAKPVPPPTTAYPPSLVAYVERAYAECRTAGQRDVMERALKTIISSATDKGILHTRQWELFPTPPVTAEPAKAHALKPPPPPPPPKPQPPTPTNTQYYDLLLQQQAQQQQALARLQQQRAQQIQQQQQPLPPPPQLQPMYMQSNPYASAAAAAVVDYEARARLAELQRMQIIQQRQQQQQQQQVLQQDEPAQKRVKAATPQKSKKELKREKHAELLAAAQAAKAAKTAKAAKAAKANKGALGFVDERSHAKRVERFGEISSRTYMSSQDSGDWTPPLAVRVVGTNESLEKPYLRLTSAPDPSSVRPERVLRKTLAMLLERWDGSESAYTYVSEQFRSMRQDLTVQSIKNDFSVEVYERNARIALEMSDLFEFNACQTQLWALYKIVADARKNFHEFMAYRVLYFVHTRNVTELSAMYGDASFSFEPPMVMHAEHVRRAVDGCNWVQYRVLYDNAPLMSGRFMELMADSFRKKALVGFCRAYKGVTMDRLKRAMDCCGDSGEFLLEHVVMDAASVVDTQATIASVLSAE